MPTYRVEYPISFGKGKRVKSRTVPMSAEDAAPLLNVGALSGPIDHQNTTNTHSEEAQPVGGMADDGTGSSSAPPGVDEHSDDGLTDREHSLRAYVRFLKSDNQPKPKIGEARKATGIKNLTAAQLNEAWAD